MSDRTTSRLSGLQFVNPHRYRDGSSPQAHAVVPATRPAPLPGTSRELTADIDGAGRTWTLREWLEATTGTSLVVVDRGTLVHEWYAEGVGPDDLLLGASMTKSALAHLVGLAVTAGAVTTEDRVVDHVPELAGSGYTECSVADLLTMTTGVDAVEDHRDPASFASRLLDCFWAGPGAGDRAGDSRALLATVGSRHPPGTHYEYCTGDSQVLDWVRERATGTSYASALGDLWAALGCESAAVVSTDGVGTALAGGGLAATARDWVRIGMLQVCGTVDGTRQGERLLDREWVERSSRPSQPFLAPGRLPSSITTHAGFGFHWWPLDDAGRRVTADGSRGQFAYADRETGVVVLKTSQWPYDDWLADRQSRDLSYLGLPVVAEAARAGASRRRTRPSGAARASASSARSSGASAR